MTASVRLLYQTRKGAGIMRSLPPDADVIQRTLSNLKVPARLMVGDERIGEVWKNDGSWGDGKRQWLWFFDAEALR